MAETVRKAVALCVRFRCGRKHDWGQWGRLRKWVVIWEQGSK